MTLLVSKPAPDFAAPCVTPENKLSTVRLSDYRGKYVVMFFYPLNFTYVCPTELIAVNNRLWHFESKNAVVLTISVDSHYSHLKWKRTTINDGGIGDVNYTMVSDLDKKISIDYDVLTDDSIAARATFLIDPDGIVQHQSMNSAPFGRDMGYFDYLFNMIEGIENFKRNGEVCPAGWAKLKQGMQPNDDGVSDYLSSHATDV